MKIKISPWLLLSGLAVCGLAVSAEPAAPQDAAPLSTSLKVGIDPITGKRRVLTVEESAALDTQAQKQTNMRAARSAPRLGTPASLPATAEEAIANGRTANGITGFKPPASLVSSLQVTRDASGKVTMTHSDPSQDAAAPSANATEELPSE